MSGHFCGQVKQSRNAAGKTEDTCSVKRAEVWEAAPQLRVRWLLQSALLMRVEERLSQANRSERAS
jgi:hypothetical protein